MGAHYLGVDVGGTKTEVCLIHLPNEKSFERFHVLARERIETQNYGTLESYLPRLKTLYEKVLSSQEIPPDQLTGIGVGIPGSVDPKKQIMVQGNLAFLKGVPLQETFQKLFSYPKEIIFENDANCFALAECYLGAGFQWAQKRSIPLSELCAVGIILGTGVGGGLFVNGKILRGRRGGGGEIGHMTLIESGRSCYCGKSGCAEQYLSGRGLELSYSERVDHTERKTAKEIFKLADEGDPHATAAIEGYRDLLVLFLSNLSNLLDPHLFVLGGGVSSQDRLYAGIETRLSESCFLSQDPPAVLKNEAGDSAGVFGAALLSFSKGAP